MDTGMLWYDDRKKTPLSDKIKFAVGYYFKKYGHKPNICLIHPAALAAGDEAPSCEGVTIRPYRPVLPNHLWIGVEEKV